MSKRIIRSKFLILYRYLSCSRWYFRKKDQKISVSNDFQYKDFFADTVKDYDFQEKDEKPAYVSADLISVSDEHTKKKKNRSLKLFELGYRGELLYGIHPVYLALKYQKRSLYHLFIKDNLSSDNEEAKFDLKEDILKMADNLRIDVTCTRLRELNHLAPGRVHQGVCLDASPYPVLPFDGKSEESSASDKIPLWLVLNEIIDPMNIGAVLRSAYYFGVDKILLNSENSCRLSPTVSKASAGALEVLDVYEIQDLLTFLNGRKRKDWNIISASSYKEKNSHTEVLNLRDFQLTKPSILILGNEGRGIDRSVHSLCSHTVSIHPGNPLHGGMDSLNVSVAAGVLLYHLLGRN